MVLFIHPGKIRVSSERLLWEIGLVHEVVCFLLFVLCNKVSESRGDSTIKQPGRWFWTYSDTRKKP